MAKNLFYYLFLIYLTIEYYPCPITLSSISQFFSLLKIESNYTLLEEYEKKF
jgi:hypothetical protein